MVLSFAQSHAQSTSDTLSLAKKLKDDNKLAKAFQSLSEYEKNHPSDLNSIWLSAQIAFWMHHPKISESLYKEAINDNPGNYYLKLDYAKMLADEGDYDSALSILNIYLSYDPSNTDAWLTINKIYYWQGNYSSAFSMAENIVKHNPSNKQAKELLNEILLAKSLWLKINGDYNSDDQPLKSIYPSVEAGKFLSQFATIHLSAGIPFFSVSGNTSNDYLFNAGIGLDFNKLKLKTNISAGFVRFAYNNDVAFTGNISVEKIFLKNFVLTATDNRQPYLYSLASIDTNLVENNVAFSAAWKNQYTINVEAGFSLTSFADDNTISSFYATVYSPLLKAGLLSLQLGYGFNYSTSKQNKFAPKQSAAEIISNPGSKIDGIYIPYFTPNDQLVNSMIATANYKPTNKIEIGGNVGYGFYATTQDPYFSITTSDAVAKAYAKEKFSPVDAGCYLLWQASVKTSIKASYQYHSTFFYTNNYIGFSLKTSFWHEK